MQIRMQQIGTKQVTIQGRNYQVRVYESFEAAFLRLTGVRLLMSPECVRPAGPQLVRAALAEQEAQLTIEN